MLNYKELPPVLAEFLAAQNRFDADAFVRTFAADAIVHDEGNNYYGSVQIKQWNEATNTKYHAQMEPLELAIDGQEMILTILMSGTFDGSPLPARFRFKISNDKIISLSVG
jgi:ketosteroid isomerase-like protein